MGAAGRRRPAWLREHGLASIFLGEPPTVLKYAGGEPAEAEAGYARALSEETLARLAAAGINLLFLRFFAGFGMEFEKQEEDLFRDCAARAHARGLRLAARLTLGSLVPETLLNEEQDAPNWFQANQEGQTPATPAGHPPCRVRPCLNAEGYLRYMERVCEQALSAGADLIFFDDLGCNPEPDTCRCPVCVAEFREMLRREYGSQDEQTRAAGMARFGHTTFTHLRPPAHDAWLAGGQFLTLEGPHQQEWLRFKVRSLTRCLERLAKFCERKQPECALGALFFRPPEENAAHRYGLDSAEQLPFLDLVWTSEPHPLDAALADGRPAARFRSARCARAFDSLLALEHLPPPERLVTGLAEQLALQPLTLGNFGTLSSGDTWLRQDHEAGKQARAFLAFYRRHWAELFRGARPLSWLGFYRDSPSLDYDQLRARLSQTTVEQLLFDAHAPFELLFPGQLDDLPRFRAVVLAGAACISESACEKLRAFVEAGGGLLATEETGRLDEWRRPRPRGLLEQFFGPAFASGEEQPVAASVGQGKVVWLPRIAYPLEPATLAEQVMQRGVLPPGAWGLPLNAAEVLEALSAVAGEPPWTARAASGVPLVETQATAAGGFLVHAAGLDPHQPVRELAVSLAAPAAPRQIQPLSPFGNYDPLPFEYDAERKRLTFCVSEVQEYVLFHVC